MDSAIGSREFKFEKGIDDEYKLISTLDEHNSLEVYEKGAHISSWVSGGKEQLFLSKKPKFSGNSALRGGIPIIFPQFSDMGKYGIKHGFARVTRWKLESYRLEEGEIKIVFSLQDTEETLKVWPHRFKFVYEILMSSSRLQVNFSIENRNEIESFPFQLALHTYYAVPDIHHVKINNLNGLKYLDNCKNRKEFTHDDEQKFIEFDSELDVIYLSAPSVVQILSDGVPITAISKGNSTPDAVVWNPWIEKTKGFADLNESDYEKFVCIEPGTIVNPPDLSPSQIWFGTMSITPLSSRL